MGRFSNLLLCLEFFENIKGALKQLRVILGRTDAFHHCNRLLVSLNSKFDELKEIH